MSGLVQPGVDTRMCIFVRQTYTLRKDSNMNLQISVIFPIIAAALFISCLSLVSYFKRRERRLLSRIQNMLDQATFGSFEDKRLDESGISMVECSMHRYLSDNQMTQERLKEDSARIQSLISDISHQTVTPVANITLYSQLLEEWVKQSCVSGELSASQKEQIEQMSQDSGARSNEQEAVEMIRAMGQQAEKLGFLVEALVKLSRLESGIIHVNPQKQPIQPVLSALEQQLAPKAQKRDIRLITHSSGAQAAFDFKWTVEAGINLVDNAVKYTPEGGTVTISVREYSFFICICIADSGPGIAEQEQANIFRRFYRGAGTEHLPGLGIGLHLAREVAKAQGGYIKLSSKPGEGSVFSLFLLKEQMSQN